MKLEISDYGTDGSGREVSIEISDHDTYSLYHTLSLIIAPLIEAYIKKAQTKIELDEEDIAELNKIQKTFEDISNDEHDYEDGNRSIHEGLNLFSKKYLTLWW